MSPIRQVLEIDRLTLGYGSRVVLADFSLRVGAGEAVVVRGGNGAGKSTLLRCVAGLHPAAAGTVWVGDRAADETSPHFRRMVAALLDDGAWYPSLTVGEHVELVRRVNQPVTRPWWEAGELVDLLGLAPVADDPPTRLSSGQRQRLALAMTFARPSGLLLLDEPERHLDAAGRATVAALVGEYVGAGGAALVTTHDPILGELGRVVELRGAAEARKPR
jgi:ABC-2 type transport system ATP-binding protein